MSKLTKRLSELRAKGTQGEWEAKNCGVGVKGTYWYIGYPSGRGAIASIYDGKYIENENEYDAQLIVETINALPKLLERDRVMVKALENISENSKVVDEWPNDGSKPKEKPSEDAVIAKQALQEIRRIEDE